ncbi:MAG: DUF1553 domain-containing protein [Planctomycetota bacterium]
MQTIRTLRKTRTAFVALMVLAICMPLHARRRSSRPRPTQPRPNRTRVGQFQSEKRFTGTGLNHIDTLVMANLRKQGIQPAALCTDQVFLRRVYLDVTGTLPEPEEIRKFFANSSPGLRKRAALIRTLLQSDEFADYWSLKWGDLLRIKAEFPINLWPNAVQAYHRWIHDALQDNMPYDQFARELLTSSGSNFRVPQVNFYRAIQGQEPSAIAGAVALTFMGVRLDQWPEAKRCEMETFFSRVAYKGTAEWKEEILYLDPAATDPLEAVFPDGRKVTIKPGEDPRIVFADWLVSPDNKWFARNIVNRVWAWLMGRGLIHEPDDIRPDNPALHPQVLAYLEKELVKSKYDLRHIFRLILGSATYQQSSIPKTNYADAEAWFACYSVRRLEAEVLIDALCWISQTQETYSSPIPEPFTFIPGQNRTVELADGSITSQFLEMFGRPARDTGLESERNNHPTDSQRLHMLNSSHIQTKIDRSSRINTLVRNAKGKRPKLIGDVYLTILSRYPSQEELAVADQYYHTKGLGNRLATNDLVWALINTKEFLYRH